MMLRLIRLTLTAFCLLPYAINACTGGTNTGAITPTSSFQTIAVLDGEYYTSNVVCGTTYTFTFCNNGGASGSLFPEITILDASGTVELAFSPYVSGCSELIWTAPFTGSIQVLITDSGCFSGLTYNGTMAYQASSTPLTFTYTSVCGGANATVSSSGGVFSWNPSDPGDGSLLNTTTGDITNGVDGANYTIDYTICGSTTTQTAAIPSVNCWTLNGDANYINIGGEQCIELTGETNNQTGCAWNGSQIDFSLPFTLSLDYYFGNNTNGADGSTFTFQPSSSTACGTAGGQIGAGALSNALTIEFDTYDNDNPTHLYDMACDHIAVEIDGNLQGPGAPLCGPVCAKAGGGNIDDNGTYAVDITWNPTTQQLDIYFDGVLRLSCSHDFITNVFGTNIVYWGVTSATGGLNNQQYFCPSTVVLPVELARFTNYCNGDFERIEWETVSENKVSHFVLESTLDGILFEPIATVQAMGNTQSANVYNVDVSAESAKQTLYRLKTVDESGSFEYTSLLARKNCDSGSGIISEIIMNSNGVKIGLNEHASYSLYNQLGQLIVTRDTEEHQIDISSSEFSSGIYTIHLSNSKGEFEVQRIFLK
jgi:hypothetical protein